MLLSNTTFFLFFKSRAVIKTKKFNSKVHKEKKHKVRIRLRRITAFVFFAVIKNIVIRGALKSLNLWRVICNYEICIFAVTHGTA